MAVVALAACGGDGESDEVSASAEDEWRALLAARDLEPDRDVVEVSVEGEPPTLRVTIRVPETATGELFFADALYGAEAYTFRDGAWERVDTADVRAEVAPVLAPGEQATLELPVEEADSYRVLVPVAGKAAWGDSDDRS
jgi:hypothetical protein